ncbi:MAG: cytochrome c biogenesis protein CcdA [Bacteroidota bacterium]
MESWINATLNSGNSGITVLIAVFLMGMISVLSCTCNFAVIGLVAGYTGTVGATSKSRQVIFSSIFFLIGTVVSLAIIGGLIGYAGHLINASLGSYWKIAAGIISIVFGLYTIDFFPFKIPGISLKNKKNSGGIFSAILFGLLVGGLSSALSMCCNPIFPIVLAASFIKGSMIWGMLMLITFAFGFGLPLAAAMIGLGLGIGKVSSVMNKFGTVIKYVGGISLILIGFYFLFTI